MLNLNWNFFIIFIAIISLNACALGIEASVSPTGGFATKAHQPSNVATMIPTSSATFTAPISPKPSATPRPSNTALPTATASPTPLECWGEGGKIEKGKLETDLLRLPLDYRVYLPPCYNQQPERRYPVLYLIHGQSYNDEQWDRLGADEAADQLISEEGIPPFIIVMPRDRYGGQPSENNFARVLIEELVANIDANYRTLDEREYRAVGGLSRGGGWAVHLALTHWDVFGALGGHSPAIFFDDAQRMWVYLDAIPPESMPRIYLDIGDRDRPEIMRAAIWFEDLLNQRSVPHEWYLFSGYHVEDYWRDHLEIYLRWYSQSW